MKQKQQFLTVREYANAKNRSINGVRVAILEHRLQATKAKNGRWLIDSNAVIRRRDEITEAVPA